jgi:hypothetical protein
MLRESESRAPPSKTEGGVPGHEMLDTAGSIDETRATVGLLSLSNNATEVLSGDGYGGSWYFSQVVVIEYGDCGGRVARGGGGDAIYGAIRISLFPI